MAASLQLFILCYNRAPLARQAIQSALKQSGLFQLIISDNSTDNETQAMVAAEFPQLDYRRRVPHLKALDHFNVCIDEATSSHVCLFHDDDLLSPSYAARVVAAMHEHPEAAAIGVNAWIAEEGQAQRLSFSTARDAHLVRDARQLASHYFGRYQTGIAPFPGYAYAKARLGGLRFDAGRGKYSDVSWLLGVVERGPMVWLAEPLMTYRLHASNDSRNESLGDRLRLLAYFKRHVSSVGDAAVEDLRFFIYKKALGVGGSRARELAPSRRNVIKRYLTRYRWRRVVRVDQHLALMRRLGLRFFQRFASSATQQGQEAAR